MNPTAFKLLDEMKLPKPRLYLLDEVPNLTASTNLYLRFDKTSGTSNCVVSASEVVAKFSTYERLVAEGLLLAVESTYSMLAGGAIALSGCEAYIEIVWGHPIILLRRGRVAQRIFLDRGSPKHIICQSQEWQAVQSNGYLYNPCGAVPPSLSEQILSSIHQQLAERYFPPTLVEWFMTNEELIFCDARRELAADYASALCQFGRDFDPLSVATIWERPHPVGKIDDDLGDVDYMPAIASAAKVIVRRSSLMSHRLTRALNNVSCIQFQPTLPC